MPESSKYDLSGVLDLYSEKAMGQVHTAIPAFVSSYDSGSNLAVIQPSVKMRTMHNEEVAYPAIADVPVQFPNSKAFSLEFPLSAGDMGLLIFCEVGIGAWTAGNGTNIVCTDDMTRFSLADAIFIPGVYPEGKKTTGKAFIKIDSSGKYLIGNNAGELFEQLVLQIDELIADFTDMLSVANAQFTDWTSLVSALGIGATSAAANQTLATTLTTSLTNLEAIKEVLEGMKQ